jgi:hypothetical protein
MGGREGERAGAEDRRDADPLSREGKPNRLKRVRFGRTPDRVPFV